jgi:hypothetical protein
MGWDWSLSLLIFVLVLTQSAQHDIRREAEILQKQMSDFLRRKSKFKQWMDFEQK